MKTLFVLVVLFLGLNGINAQPQPDSKAVTHFYIVNIDNDLSDVVAKLNPAKKALANKAVQNGDEFVAGIIDTFYSIAREKFKTEFSLNLLPLKELQGKIKYNSIYTQCPEMTNIKKVLKSAAGYDYYADYFVNVFSGLPENSAVKPSIYKIKPVCAISFTIYDNTGKIVKKIEVSYKSPDYIADAKIDKISNKQQMVEKLCKLYNETLKEVSQEYKKSLTALN